MTMVTRRNVLVGLGGLVAGSGALFATGAFTTVQAQRTVTIETAGDAGAFLALEAARPNDEYVGTTSDGRIQIFLDGTDAAAQGINRGARSRFENLVNVTNQGTEDVDSLTFQFDVTGADQNDADVEAALKITSGDTTIAADGSQNLVDESVEGGVGDDVLGPGEFVPFGIEVDLLNSNVEDISGNPTITLTITAESTNA